MPTDFKVAKDRRVFLGGVEIEKCLGFSISFEAGGDPELLLRVSCDSVDIDDYSLMRKESHS